ncbi:methanethiol oxidase isoform X1 [Hetaerina americana]|uniref:methanethiol oxidase isoform X1 n=2 Tax=Hetaerina americana TaxID=62018 RepID=UPI003A7F3AAE
MAPAGKACCQRGPGFSSPLAAMKGPREKILYIPCIQPDPEGRKKGDYLATIDIDVDSPTYCKVIHRTYMKYPGDEVHHSGWNVCSSCNDDENKTRDKMVLPCLNSDRVYIVDMSNDPKAPKLCKVIEPSEMHAWGMSTPHTSHCLPSGEIMLSTMGDGTEKDEGKGDFLLIDAHTLEVKGRWRSENSKPAKFGYDFWYQPYFDVMVSTEWGTPRIFKTGFDPKDAYDQSVYGRSLNIWSWKKRELLQTIDLGEDGVAPLEVRFAHDPKKDYGYVGCALNAVVYQFFRKEDGTWDARQVIKIPKKKVEGWVMPEMAGMMTDIIMSLDDRYLYFSNWLHGDVRQYDITDPSNPRLVGQIFLGGSILEGGPVKVVSDPELKEQPKPVTVMGRRLYGAPQMLQLSLDGTRLYITSSLFSPWDKQFYPEMVKHGSTLVRVDVDTVNGGLKLDEKFLVDFGLEPDGPMLAHEVRYPGGDCTSDIWLAETSEQ